MSETWSINRDNQLHTLSRKMSSVTLLSLESDDFPINPEEEEEEMKGVREVVMALKLYRKCAYVHLNKTENYLNSLPKRQQKMLSKYRDHLSTLRDCIDKNQDVINKMLRENASSINEQYQGIHSIQDLDINCKKTRHHMLEKRKKEKEPN